MSAIGDCDSVAAYGCVIDETYRIPKREDD
jgi:hypothetical protein